METNNTEPIEPVINPTASPPPIIKVHVPPVMLQFHHEDPSPPTTTTPSFAKKTKSYKRTLSNIERFHHLKAPFYKLYKSIIQDYLVNTIHYESKENMERLEKTLFDKFVIQSRPTKIDTEIPKIRSYLNNMKEVFKCFYDDYMSESSLFLFRHPALLKKRVDVFIAEYITTKKYTKINKKTRKQICESISSSVSSGGQRKRYN